MRTGVLAVTVGVFAALAVAVAVPATAGESGDEDAGRRVFQANCAMCHGGDGSGMMGMHPSLRGAVDRLTREGVEVTIRNGRDTRPPMPAFGGRLSDEQIDDVIAYIGSLPSGPRNFGPERDGRGTSGRGGGRMMDRGMMMGGGLAMLLMVLFVIGLLVLAVTATVWLVRKTGSGSSTSSAREELDRRYAAGEIDRDDYLQRRRDLES